MSHITNKFWLGLGFVAIVWLLLVGNVASGQTPPPPNTGETVLLSGFLSCAAPNNGPAFCPFRLHYVTLTQGRTYLIRMESADFDTRLAVENLQGDQLASNDDCWDTLNGAIVFRPNSTASYRMIASNAAPVEGFYTIAIREVPVVLNVEAALTTHDAAWHDGFERFYEVVLRAGRRYVIDLESRDFDSFVRLMTRENVIVAFADECDAMGNARVVFVPLEDGIYRLGVTSNTSGATGTFRLTVTDATHRRSVLIADR